MAERTHGRIAAARFARALWAARRSGGAPRRRERRVPSAPAPASRARAPSLRASRPCPILRPCPVPHRRPHAVHVAILPQGCQHICRIYACVGCRRGRGIPMVTSTPTPPAPADGFWTARGCGGARRPPLAPGAILAGGAGCGGARNALHVRYPFLRLYGALARARRGRRRGAHEGRRGRRRTPQRARRDERPAMLGAGPVHSARCGRGGRRRYEDCQGRGRKRRPFVQAGQEAVSPGGASDGGPPRPVSRRSHTAGPQSAPAARGAAGMYFRAGGAAPPWRTRQSEECSWPWTGRPTPTGPSTWRCEWPRRRPQPWPGSSR